MDRKKHSRAENCWALGRSPWAWPICRGGQLGALGLTRRRGAAGPEQRWPRRGRWWIELVRRGQQAKMRQPRCVRSVVGLGAVNTGRGGTRGLSLVVVPAHRSMGGRREGLAAHQVSWGRRDLTQAGPISTRSGRKRGAAAPRCCGQGPASGMISGGSVNDRRGNTERRRCRIASTGRLSLGNQRRREQGHAQGREETGTALLLEALTARGCRDLRLEQAALHGGWGWLGQRLRERADEAATGIAWRQRWLGSGKKESAGSGKRQGSQEEVA